LKLGAAPVTCAADVLALYDLEPVAAYASSLGPVADALLERLRVEPLRADELVRGLTWNAEEASVETSSIVRVGAGVRR
jgi:hypothetical protein